MRNVWRKLHVCSVWPAPGLTDTEFLLWVLAVRKLQRSRHT
jgi:hypothetical protein